MKSENKKTLLLGEDDIIISTEKQQALERYGYKVQTSKTGECAISASNNNSDIDLILMDIDLGSGIDGTEAAEIILNNRKIPVVFLSSHSEKNVIEKTEKITSYGYVLKSSSITVLDASIKMAFKLFEAHQKIYESELRLNEAQHLTQIGNWELDLLTNELLWSDEIYRIFDIDPKEFGATLEAFLESIHPDDRDYVSHAYAKSVENKTPYNINHRLLLKNGMEKIVNERCETYYDENGKPARSLGTVQDITRRKQVEKALSEANTIINRSPAVAFLWKNEKGWPVEFATDNIEKLFGYSAQELVEKKKSYIDIIHHDDYKRVAEEAAGFSSTEGLKTFSHKPYRIITKNEETKWIADTTYIRRDSNGLITYYEGILHDITDQKNAENEIKSQLAEKEVILKEAHHRIKNNFASIVNLLSLQSDSLTNPEAISALKDAIGRVNSMHVLYEKLLLTDNYNVTSLKQYMETLIEGIACLFPENINIFIEKQIDDIQLEPKRLYPVGIIINELLTNTMKYGFTGRDSGLIQITLKEGQRNVSLTIQDNGIGLPEGFDFDKEEGFGLMLIKILCDQLEGSFTINNNKMGTVSTLNFSI